MSGWQKKPAIPSGGPACLCCGTPTDVFPMEGVIAVGFGAAAVTKDGQCVYDEPQQHFDDNGESVEQELEYWTGADAEKAASADPDHDWQISKHGPMYSAVYQRHGPEQWVLIERGDGPEKGSWKGGMTGHSAEMLPGDTPEAAFRRYCEQEQRSKSGRYRITFSPAPSQIGR